MKKILLAIAALFMLMSVSVVDVRADDFTYDDFNHVLLGNNPWEADLTTASHYLVGTTSAYGAGKFYDRFMAADYSWWVKPLVQVGTAFAVGAVIETFDRNYDWKDVGDYTSAGGVTAFITWSFEDVGNGYNNLTNFLFN